MTDEVSTCIALLHDIADALRLLNYGSDADHSDYVRAIRANPIAMAIKLADLAHSSDETRFAGCENMGAPQLTRWQEKHTKAKAILKEIDRRPAVRCTFLPQGQIIAVEGIRICGSLVWCNSICWRTPVSSRKSQTHRMNLSENATGYNMPVAFLYKKRKVPSTYVTNAILSSVFSSCVARQMSM